jgi:hypothetical protein
MDFASLQNGGRLAVTVLSSFSLVQLKKPKARAGRLLDMSCKGGLYGKWQPFSDGQPSILAMIQASVTLPEPLALGDV